MLHQHAAAKHEGLRQSCGSQHKLPPRTALDARLNGKMSLTLWMAAKPCSRQCAACWACCSSQGFASPECCPTGARVTLYMLPFTTGGLTACTKPPASLISRYAFARLLASAPHFLQNLLQGSMVLWAVSSPVKRLQPYKS